MKGSKVCRFGNAFVKVKFLSAATELSLSRSPLREPLAHPHLAATRGSSTAQNPLLVAQIATLGRGHTSLS